MENGIVTYVQNKENFDRHFDRRTSEDRKFQKKKSRNDRIKISPICFLTSWIPILGWLPKYEIRHNLISDMIGGITVGIISVPQGMAYASLAGLRPVNGLYTSLFPPLIYMIFGTSRHISLGVFAVVSLMVGSCNLRVTELLVNAKNNGSNIFNPDSDENLEISIAVVTSLALLVGVIQIAMALLRLDFLTDYLSIQVIEGFTTGAAVHVFSAQLNKIIGVSLPRANSLPKLYWIYKELITKIIEGQTNWVTFVISIITIVLLYSAKNFLDPKIKGKCRFPVPYDLFVMIFGAILSECLNLNGKYHVKIIGKIPTGLPLPSLPDPSLFTYFVSDAMAIAVVVLVTTVSMGKLMASKHGYDIDVRQEFYAIGFMETICSLFPCWPSSTALARTLVYEMAGTKTQLATIFSSILLLSVIFYIGPFIEVLPTCFLSCIIIVALKGMFMQLRKIPILWKCSKPDCVIFIVTFLATVIFDVVPGLSIGVAVGVLAVLHRMQKAQLVELGIVQDEKQKNRQHYFEPIEEYSHAKPIDNVKIIQFGSPLVFLNAEHFKKQIFEETQDHSKNLPETNGNGAEKTDICLLEETIKNEITTYQPDASILILDLKKVTSVDYTGAKTLIEVYHTLKKKNIALLYAEADSRLISILKKFCSPDEFHKIYENFYPSIYDALDSTTV